MKIDIWSDVMCPFCYIGKKHIEAAIEQLPFKNEVEVEWKSFQLAPDLSPTEAMDISTYLLERKGMEAAQVEGMNAQLAEMGKSLGIEFNMDAALAVNTSDAHRLIHLAHTKTLGSAMKERLFKAYFTEGKNVADATVLIQLATEVGLDAKEVEEMLISDAFVFEVASDALDAQDMKVQGVPFFVLDRKYGISGAQPVASFIDALTQTYNEGKVNPSTDGASCDVDGNCN